MQADNCNTVYVVIVRFSIAHPINKLSNEWSRLRNVRLLVNPITNMSLFYLSLSLQTHFVPLQSRLHYVEESVGYVLDLYLNSRHVFYSHTIHSISAVKIAIFKAAVHQ